MKNIEDAFKQSILEDLFAIRTDDLESKYVEKNGEPEEKETVSAAEQELTDKINELIKDEEIKDIILSKLDDFQDAINGEHYFWLKEYYMHGFYDGYYFEPKIDSENEV